MASTTITITVDKNDLNGILAVYDEIIAGLADMSPMWDGVEMYMIDSLTQNFESEGRPTKWEPLAEWTINDKGSDTILQRTGALKASINGSNTETQAHSLDIWAGEVHGLFHQYVDMEPSAQFGILNRNRKHPMPMRPFMLFQIPEDHDAIERIAYNYLVDISSGW